VRVLKSEILYARPRARGDARNVATHKRIVALVCGLACRGPGKSAAEGAGSRQSASTRPMGLVRFWAKSYAEPHRRLSPSCQASPRSILTWSRKPCARPARRQLNCPAGAAVARSDFIESAVCKAGWRWCIFVRSAPFPRSKRRASGLSRLKFPIIFEIKAAKTVLSRCVLPCAKLGATIGVPFWHPLRLPAASAGPRAGLQLENSHQNRAAGALQGKGEW
jgi:hypothetical protein